MAAIDEIRFGRDVFVPLDPESAVRVTPTGDLPTIAGYANLSHALEAMALTVPGDLVHRPTYGGGLVEEVEAEGTPASRARAANRLRTSARADARIREATVSVTVGAPGDPARPGAVTAALSVIPVGDSVAVPVSVTVE